MNETETVNLILDMLLTTQSRLNALINYQIDASELEDFNNEVQRQRTIILKDVLKDNPQVGIKLSKSH
jgi:hypothetical protein